MRILFLTQWFDPEPHFKGLPFARELKRRGHEIVVLTGFPNYPGGRVYDGYRVGLGKRELMEGIEVIRVPLYPSHDRSGLRRAINYISFALSATLLGLPQIGKVDVAYVYHPPATIGLPALVLQWLGVPCLYDVQDLWPDTLAATGMMHSRWLLGSAGFWCKFIYRRMTHLVVLSPGFKAKLVERGVSAEDVSIIYNWSPDEGWVAKGTYLPDTERRLLAGKFNVVFAGNMGPAQALGTVLAAAGELESTHPQVQFVLVGGGVEAAGLQAEAARRGLANVLFLPRRAPAEMAAVFEASDVLLVHLRDDPLFTITIPSKTQTYLAAGRPVLMAVRGDAAELVAAAGAGRCCASENPAALSEGVRRLWALTAEERRALGEAGRRFYLERLGLARGVTQFELLFERLHARSRMASAVI